MFWLSYHQHASNVYKLLTEGVMRQVPQLNKATLRTSQHVFRLLQDKLAPLTVSLPAPAPAPLVLQDEATDDEL